MWAGSLNHQLLQRRHGTATSSITRLEALITWSQAGGALASLSLSKVLADSFLHSLGLGAATWLFPILEQAGLGRRHSFGHSHSGRHVHAATTIEKATCPDTSQALAQAFRLAQPRSLCSLRASRGLPSADRSRNRPCTSCQDSQPLCTGRLFGPGFTGQPCNLQVAHVLRQPHCGAHVHL